MHIEPLVKIDQIETGDLLLIDDGIGITHAKAQRVKVSEHDGTEVIFNLRKNKFFNVGMYLNGKSWAKDVRIVRRVPSNAGSNGPSGVAAKVALDRRVGRQIYGGMSMATIKLKGPWLNDWFAEQLVKDHGQEGARAKCCGPALAAVERVIASMEAAEEERQFAHAEAQIQTGGF